MPTGPMPVHREVLVDHQELERAEERLADAIEELRVELLERDLGPALERLDELRDRANELEATLLRVQP